MENTIAGEMREAYNFRLRAFSNIRAIFAHKRKYYVGILSKPL